jgi:hypothetical protein
MPNFILTDANGQRHSLTEQQLQTLAAKGKIQPTTPLETDTGHKGLAGQIPGLKFSNAAPPPFAQPAQVAQSANVFCTNCGNSVSAQAVACMSCGARPTGHKKFCRHCGGRLNPEQVVCIKCGAALASYSGIGNSGVVMKPLDAADTLKKLNTYFKVLYVSIIVAVGSGFLSGLLIIWAESIYSNGGDVPFFVVPLLVILVPVAVIATIAVAVFKALMLYLLWRVIPEDIARTTPGKAVGFIFIPFFNFYWNFIAFWGLGKDMNATLEQRGIQYQVNEKNGMSYCIGFIFQFWDIKTLAFRR